MSNPDRSKILTKRHPRYSQYDRALIQVTATVVPGQINKLPALLEAGVSHFRLNLSHYDPWNRSKAKYPTKEDYDKPWKALVRRVCSESQDRGIPAAIMLDTAGPEFRVRPVRSKRDPKGKSSREIRVSNIALSKGETIILSARLRPTDSGATQQLRTVFIDMPYDFKGFPESAKGKIVRIKDGVCEGTIEAVDGLQVKVRLKQDITLAGKEKLNFPGLDFGQDVPSVGKRDRDALEFFLRIPVKEGSRRLLPIGYVAQSFVKSVDDVNELRANLKNIRPIAHEPLIIPKLETREAVQEPTLQDILKCQHAAAIMIARGDLANETTRSQVPRLQRRIIELCHHYWKPVLLATQIYGSMEDQNVWQSSRPEAEDLRSALDWAIDGVVLTAETAKRKDPERVVQLLLRQAAEDELDIEERKLHQRKRDLLREEFEEKYTALLEGKLRRDDDFPLRDYKDFSTADMALAAVHRANNRKAAAILPFTMKGNSVRDIVHFLPYRPIFPFTLEEQTIPRLLLYRGVFPMFVRIEKEPDQFDISHLKQLMRDAMRRFRIGEKNSSEKNGEDAAIGTMAHPISAREGTDVLVWIRRHGY